MDEINEAVVFYEEPLERLVKRVMLLARRDGANLHVRHASIRRGKLEVTVGDEGAAQAVREIAPAATIVTR